MDVFSDKNNYIVECMKCGCTAFKLLPDGYVGCMQCNKRFSWVGLFKNWVPHTMSPEEYLIKVMNKSWDPVTQEFVDKDKIKKPIKKKKISKKPKKKKGSKKDEDAV